MNLERQKSMETIEQPQKAGPPPKPARITQIPPPLPSVPDELLSRWSEELVPRWGCVSVIILGKNEERRYTLIQNEKTGELAIMTPNKVLFQVHYAFLRCAAAVMPIRAGWVHQTLLAEWGDVPLENIGSDANGNTVYKNLDTGDRALVIKIRNCVVFETDPKFKAAEPDFRLYGVSYPVGGNTWKPR